MGLEPDAGPGLVFHTLPIVFQKMPGGALFGTLFFLLLTIAALTSAISLLEVVCAYFIDEKKWRREKAVLIWGSTIFLLGIPAALSFGPLKNVTVFCGFNFFDFADALSSNYMLPLGGLLIAIFVGWIWGVKEAVKACREGAPAFKYAWIWSISIRYIAPAAVIIILIQQSGILNLFQKLCN
jgi:NSS family neurotransmitter:Na+ symporter